MHPVAILSALFCMVLSLVKFVAEMMGDQTVLPYSKTDLVNALNVVISVSFCFPHLEPVRALMMFSDFCAFSWVMLTCSAKVSFGSKVTPKILGFFTVGIRLLAMVSVSCVLCSFGSCVKSVAVDF